MKRREFIRLLGGAAVAARSLAARAQETAMPVIGFMNIGWPETYANRLTAFRQGLSATGYVADQNVKVEVRSTIAAMARFFPTVSRTTGSDG